VGQFGLLNQMQGELEQEETALELRLLGVNYTGREDGNAAAVAGKTLPWLQDTESVNAWGLWGVTSRDLVILDEENRTIGVYNLTKHDLHRPAAYDSLKAILLAAAR
jgi:hypothetical protein